MNNADDTPLNSNALALLDAALTCLKAGFPQLPQSAGSSANLEQIEKVLQELSVRLRDNYPYFHPLYAGQMLKPPHLIAHLAYSLALWINPNNHALDGGRATSFMEKEAVAQLAGMFGWKTHLGHLSSGGTMANLEALWVSRQLQGRKVILASSQAHYTHGRMCEVLGVPFETVPADRQGRMSLQALSTRLQQGGVATIVATLGTTATGSIDPLPEILELRNQFGFRVHVDAAYGGYFTLCEDVLPHVRRAFDSLAQVDSIVIDPHKHGLQPYGCGCVLFRDPAVGQLYRHESPYTYFTSTDLHLGEISLECSRPGASAAALWATLRLLPLIPRGGFALNLAQSRSAANDLFDRLRADTRFITAFPPELDIVVWTLRAPRTSLCSKLATRVFERAAEQGLHLALAKLPVQFFDFEQAAVQVDTDTVTCLRSVLMKPEHQDWIGRIWTRLDQAALVANQDRG